MKTLITTLSALMILAFNASAAPTVSTDSKNSSASPVASASGTDDAPDLVRLRQKQLALPLQGIQPSDLRDSFSDARGSGQHEAIDLLAPQGTPVYASDDGSIAKLFTSVKGGLTIYQFDHQQQYCYYYAHLDRYAENLQMGKTIKRGELIGYVGVTGDAHGTPHLHYTIFRLNADRKWWQGQAINPYSLLLAAAQRDKAQTTQSSR